MTRALMFQGTGSDVGKTVLVAGFCRLARNRGLSVRPFKPQNMSNNAAVADDGGEIGRGQWLQALACGVPASVHMNPVLLKPQSSTGSQIVLQGKVFGHAKGADYQKLKPTLLDKVMESYTILKKESDLILIEGAGSPAEINLRRGDIANMGFAQRADVPVVLVGDIDRGGVIASLVGTRHILAHDDCAMVGGYLINKFRGDVSLFDDGVKAIAGYTGWRCFGIIPWLNDVACLPAEDSMALEHYKSKSNGKIKIAIPILPHIANFDDLDPLLQESDVEAIFIRAGEAFPITCDLVVIPGSKSTIADMTALRERGWAKAIIDHAHNGGHVIGICGGFQMLGNRIVDQHGKDGSVRDIAGLGLLDIETAMGPEKVTRNVTARHIETGLPLNGYEIHLGQTTGPDTQNGIVEIDGRVDGAASRDKRVWGTYLHGLFQADAFRHHFLQSLGGASDGVNHNDKVDRALDRIAEQLEKVVDVNALFALAR